MDLIPFLRSSSVVDFAFILIVIMLTIVLIPSAIAVLVKAKSRKPVYILLPLALLPLIVALLGATWRLHQHESLLARYPEIGAENAEDYHATFRREFLLMFLIGVAGSTVPLLMAVAGLVIKKGPPASAASE